MVVTVTAGWWELCKPSLSWHRGASPAVTGASPAVPTCVLPAASPGAASSGGASALSSHRHRPLVFFETQGQDTKEAVTHGLPFLSSRSSSSLR